MGVVCPMMCGVGGDLFAIVHEAGGKLHGVNASGWSPAALTPEVLEARGVDGMPQSGVHSVTVPGAVAGWALLLERFGRTPLSRILEPAIALAEEGFPVAEITSEEWHNQEPFLRERSRGARGRFCPTAAAARTSARSSAIRDLAWTYRQIAERGRDGFYEGEVARRLVAGLERRGGDDGGGRSREVPGASGSSPFRRPIADGMSSRFRRTAPASPR